MKSSCRRCRFFFTQQQILGGSSPFIWPAGYIISWIDMCIYIFLFRKNRRNADSNYSSNLSLCMILLMFKRNWFDFVTSQIGLHAGLPNSPQGSDAANDHLDQEKSSLKPWIRDFFFLNLFFSSPFWIIQSKDKFS